MFDPAVSLNLVVALMAEAKPFIERFKLVHEPAHSVFKIYSNGNLRLVISGIGRNNAAAATAYLGAQSSAPGKAAVWINLGIAGHSSFPVGTLIVAHKIFEKASGVAYYPQVYPGSLLTALLTTVDIPETNYAEESAFDMEASAFASIASKFTSLEFVQSIKVVSDNPEAGIDTVSKHSVDELMQQSVDAVIDLVQIMQPSTAHRLAQTYLPKAFDLIQQKTRFSATQSVQLKRLCQRYSALGLEQRLADVAAMDFISSKEIIHFLDADLVKHTDLAGDN